MYLNAEEYEQRLEAYTNSTLRLIMDINSTSKEAASEALKITTNSELTEEQVVEQLKKLKAEYEARSSR